MSKKDEAPPPTHTELIQGLIGVAEKNHGKGAILWGDSSSILSKVEFISSGALSLDLALGGGYARGRVIEIYGPEMAGKSTLALHAVAQAQRMGLTCAIADTEHSLDNSYATKLGVNMDEVLFSQPDNAEQALDIMDLLVRSGLIGLIILDSVAALVPKAELEDDHGTHHPGAQARLMSQALRKLVGIVKKSNTTIIFTNQLRMKIGVFFGSPEVVSGGNALKFYATQRLDIRRKEVLSQGEDKYGVVAKIKVVKNKVYRPFKETLVDIEFDKGISLAKDILRLGVQHKVIEKAGSWYSYKEEKLGQGEANSTLFLEEHPEMMEAIKNEILTLVNLP